MSGREEWPREVLVDTSVFERDAAGKYVICKVCFSKGQRVRVNSRRDFCPSRWRDHANCNSHTRAAAAGCGAEAVMTKWLVKRPAGVMASSSSSSSAAGTGVTLASEAPPSGRNEGGRGGKRPRIGCPGVMKCDSDLFSIFFVYGYYADLPLTDSVSGGQYSARSTECTGDCVSVPRSCQKFTRTSCDACYEFPQLVVLQSKVNRMGPVGKVVDVIGKATFSEGDVITMQNFSRTTTKSDKSEAKEKLLVRVRAVLEWHRWNWQQAGVWLDLW
eukprot:GHVU01032850.1.p1 GENE.GHVU01032850.1~~GHVU01032850.1.p1  ORF type:complete len:273 (+),score=24.34 GHVU01032850.1:550-1368(+)